MQLTFQIEWGELRAIEPSIDEVQKHAAVLADAYNHPRNAPLLGHTTMLGIDDVVEHYESLHAQSARPFLLFENAELAGDGDIRAIANGTAEFAFLIASPDAQGKGLGTRFATMVHAFAFAKLGIDRMFASVVPVNVASRRVFEKLGYRVDDSDGARAHADPGDVTLSIDRATFDRRHAAAMADIRIAVR